MMKCYLGIVLILWCLFPCRGMSKVDSLTVNEMKECFYGSTRKWAQPVIPENIDVLVEKNGKTIHYLSHTDFLKKADGNDLPPSRYAIRKDNNEKYHLYWVGLRNHNTKKENELKAKLKKKFGNFYLDNETEAIPAKWATGECHLLSDETLFKLLSVLASYRVSTYKFKNGYMLPLSKDVHSPLGKPQLEIDANFISGGGRIPVKVDAKPRDKQMILKDYNKAMKRAVKLFEWSINRDYVYDRSTSSSEYTILIHFDSKRNLHMVPLLPENLNETDRQLLKQLDNIIKKQRDGYFQAYYTIDGKIFPGIYLKAKRHMGLWHFGLYELEL